MISRFFAVATLLFVFAFALFGQAPMAFADPAGTANGSACDLNGPGSGGGLLYNGQCLSIGNYTSQSSSGGSVGSGTATGGSVGTGVVSPGVPLLNPLKGVDCSAGNGNCLMAFLNNILEFIINIGVVVVVLMVIYSGFKFVMAQGNESKITEARTMLFWTLIGALVLLGAKAISLGILSTVQALGG